MMEICLNPFFFRSESHHLEAARCCNGECVLIPFSSGRNPIAKILEVVPGGSRS